jgi:uncharacterized protein YchJ
MIKRVTRIFTLSLVAAFAAFVCGCATLPSSKDEENALRDRVVQMMDAKIAGNWDRVYDFYDPASRPKASVEDGSTGKGVIFKGYAIEKIEILESGKEARVETRNDITMQGFDFKDAPDVQRWVKVKGKWYFGTRAASPMGPE